MPISEDNYVEDHYWDDALMTFIVAVTVTVAEEDRAVVVPEENRTMSVTEEDRTVIVAEEHS